MALPTILDAVERLGAFARVANVFPSAGARVAVAGLHGSSDAVLVAALARRFPQRFFVVVTDAVADAERWLSDLHVLADDAAAALYPPREGYGEVEPHAEVAGERVETLERVSRGAVRILLTTARALLERTALPNALGTARLELRKGDVRRPEELAAHLEAIGFERVTMVDDVAQFSVRGGIFDIYSFGMAEPVRLEFWGDEIVELRHFELGTQRSTRPATVAVILPVDAAPSVGTPGGDRVSILALFPPDTVLVLPDESHLVPELARTWAEAEHHAELARRRGEEVVPRDQLFLPPAEVERALGTLGRIAATDPSRERDCITFPIRPPENIARDIRLLRQVVRDGTPTMILCDNAGQAERLDELLNEEAAARSPASLVIGVLNGGFVVPPGVPDRRETVDGGRAFGAGPETAPRTGALPPPTSRLPSGASGLRVLTDHEIFRRERRLRRARRYATGSALEAITTLKPGDYVVHLEHGVGIYRGIEKLFMRESTIEVAVIEYEGGDRLNVPLYRIDQVERYRSGVDVGDDAPPPRLHKLGGRRWAQQRERTRLAIEEMTQELLLLYARRHLASRPPHVPDTAWQRQLESSFLFEDTPDQRKATTDVKEDMEKPRPMDRLLVGDVGYGKTEIAIRAAFKAIQSGRQVAVLVPTTILAEQHFRTFSERLADFPVRIAVVSRFQTPKEQAAILADLAAKSIDVVIGTHRLLSDDVAFGQLGLIVVDEEHRFGVKHKEKLKHLKLETDVLTLTATPIPRTLHLSLAGLRDMTLMQTPPRDRSPVLTFVEPWDDGIIEEGIARELDRGGQVFFVHNRIETIEAIADHIRRVAPRARVAVGHGQMREKDLEEVMRRFVAGEVDVLVSTLIVESGLDVPNANTMFINRADHFGLAQLYQLRGRVGRSHRRAYCYLVVPDQVDEDAERRLQVLEHHTELGAGYRVALKDMELRGAGNLLGAEQSGHVQAVGFELYLRMLEEAVRRVQAGDAAPPVVPTDVSLDLPAYLPDDYIVAPDAKLDIYRRLTALTEPVAIEALKGEVRDRFGPLPREAHHLFASAILRLVGGELGIEGILVHGDEARVTFRDSATPRLKGLTAAFGEVQFRAEIRRMQPLSLKLTRLGGAGILDGLVRALSLLRPNDPPRGG
ncbi:MAG TPA: transcription-repair coupling factor [Gemmatimonadaceae bacterium]|nr:MAG: transcription-repair coupling factor [Gemmatimonadetes bacterium SCN 70-22]HMN08696.1 transcription-repair coupling factor [Gemmatimonadaceae bacterium]